MSEHVHDRLALAAAGALEDEAEARRVEAHLAECAECAADAAAWATLSGELRRLPSPRVPAALAARTRAGVEARFAARAERAWNRAALGIHGGVRVDARGRRVAAASTCCGASWRCGWARPWLRPPGGTQPTYSRDG